MSPPPRILRVVYRSAHHPRRVARAEAKVPYAGVYGLSETLVRAITTGEILWFRIERVAPAEIPAIRASLQRWPEALKATSALTGVTWDV